MRRLLFEWRNVLAGILFTMSCLGAARSTAALGLSGTEAGRWKVGPSGCYWDANDSGPNQCTPGGTTTGRWKQNGSQCYWDANDTGPNQCTPGSPPSGGGGGTGGSPSVGCHPGLENAAIGEVGVVTFGEAEPKFTIWIKNKSELPPARVALQAAVDEWNAKSGTTRTEFRILTTPQELQLQPHLTVEENELWKCAGLHDGKILFQRNGFRDVANRSPADAQFLMAHELGHFLGLGETGNALAPPNPPSVMNQVVGVQGQTCEQAFASSLRPPTLRVQNTDATMGKACSAAARNEHNFPAPPTQEFRQDPQAPWYYQVWMREELYHCIDNRCVLLRVTYTYQYTIYV